MNAQVIPIFGGANSTPQVNPAPIQAPASSAPNPFAALADQKNKQSAAPKPVSFPLTPEQVAIRDGFRAGHDMVIAAGAGTGKALRNDQLVLTPGGWKPIGSLSVGDQAIGSNGKPCNIVGVYPQGVRELFEVTTSDGVSIIADGDHLWTTQTTRDRQKHRGWGVRTTAKIADTLTVMHGSRVRTNHYLPMLSEPVRGAEIDLPLDPWLLGLLIGDGGLSGKAVGLSNPQPRILDAVREALPDGVELRPLSAHSSDGLNWRISASTSRKGGNPVTTALRDLGLMGSKSVDKFVPEAIYGASPDQRIAFVQGLFDADGHTSKLSTEFSTSSERLADGVTELLRSLGATVSVSSRVPKYTHNGKKLPGSRSWRLHVSFPHDIIPFRHSINRERFIPRTKYAPYRQIVSVTPVDPGEATCIKVDAEDSLFVTQGYVLTHNTSTITMLAEDMYQQDNTSRGVYLAFNKSIASEVGSKLFYGNVTAMTIHSLANKGIRNNPQYAPLMNKLGRDFREIMPLRQRAKAFGAKAQESFGEHDGPIHPKTNVPLYEVTGQTVCREAMEAVKRFCQSDDDVIGPQHVRVTKNIDKRVRDRYRARVAEIATRMWNNDLMSPQGTLPFSHDVYLKCQPPGTEVLVVDGDTRDSDGVILEVGTSVKKIEDITVGDRVVSWNGKSRYGYLLKHGAKVTHVGKREYDGEMITVTTDSGKVSRYTHDHIAIARIPRGADTRHCVYMMRKGTSFRIGRVQWKYGSQSNTLGIYRRVIMQKPDACWVLSMHDTEQEAALAEALAIHRYGIPGWQFTSLNEKMPLTDFWNEVGDLSARADVCLAAHGRDMLYPLWVEGERFLRPNTRAMEVRACNLMDGMLVCDVDGAQEMSRSTTSKTGKKYTHLSTGGWTDAWTPITIQRDKYVGTVHSIEVEKYHTYVADGIVTHNCYAMSNPDITEQLGLQGKRAVLFFDEAQDSRPCITQIVMGQRDKMQVVLCGDSSQAIYRFTGCRDAIRGFKQFDGVKSYTLSKTFRFGAPIAMVANQILNRIDGSDVRIVPDLSISSGVRIMDNNPVMDFYNLSDADAVICRSNRLLIETAMGLLGTGAKVYCATDTKMIVDIAADYRELEYGGKAKSPMMKQFRTAAEVDRFVNKQRAANAGIEVDDNDDDVEAEVDEILMSILTAVVSNGAAKVLAAMKNCEDNEDNADVVVSTIHKSKGRQWNHVVINWDMRAFGRTSNENALNDELMLLYVAITRARELVSIPEAMFKTLGVTFPVVSNGAHVAPRMGLDPATIDASFGESVQYVQSIVGAPAGNPHTLSIIEQVVSGGMAPHELVNALVFASDKYLRNVPSSRDSRGLILMAFLVSVGISSIQEVMELSDSGIPDELLAAMLTPNPINLNDKELDIITKMLNPSE